MTAPVPAPVLAWPDNAVVSVVRMASGMLVLTTDKGIQDAFLTPDDARQLAENLVAAVEGRNPRPWDWQG